ncbi:MAG: VOC family protein [Actinomycetota bacterium]
MDYVILFAADLERSTAFYRDVIGLEPKVRGEGYVEFRTGPTRFGLFERSKLPDLIGRPGGEGRGVAGEIVLIVPDVDAEAGRLRAAGAEILSDPTDRPWGHRTLHVADPDGNVVELAQEIPRLDPD